MSKEPKFSEMAKAIEDGLTVGWIIEELKYDRSRLSWYVYARSKTHFLEHEFCRGTAIQDIITKEIETCIEIITAPPNLSGGQL